MNLTIERVVSRRVAVGLALVFATAATLTVTQPFSSSAAMAEEDWLLVQPQLLENQLGLVGRIEAANKQILSAPFEGLIQQLTVSEGQKVERSQKLITLDTTQLDIHLRQALAELLKARRAVQDIQYWANSDEVARARRTVTNAELSFNDTQSKLSDTRRLFERGIVARMEVEAQEQQLKLQQLDLAAAKSELNTAQAKGHGENRQIADMELANARARYDSLLAQQGQRELHAPFTGIVLRPQKGDGLSNMPPAQVGQRVTQGLPLFELVSLERVNAITRIEEADLHQLSEGMSVQITGDGFDGLILDGYILSIGAQSLASQTYTGGSSYEVIVAINPLTIEQQQRVRLGMSARLAMITYRNNNGLALPPEALHQDGKGIYVIYSPTANGTGQRLSVNLGRAVSQGVEVTGMQPGYVKTILR